MSPTTAGTAAIITDFYCQVNFILAGLFHEAVSI
jgi:hypothetical protein